MTLVRARAGSHLYGIHTDTSDEDWREVQLASVDELIGMGTPPTGKQIITGNQDIVVWELRHVARQLAKASPTAWELVCTPHQYTTIWTPYWAQLVALRRELVHAGIATSHAAYAKQTWQSGVSTGNGKQLGEAVRVVQQGIALLTDIQSYTPVLCGDVRDLVIALRAGTPGAQEAAQVVVEAGIARLHAHTHPVRVCPTELLTHYLVRVYRTWIALHTTDTDGNAW